MAADSHASALRACAHEGAGLGRYVDRGSSSLAEAAQPLALRPAARGGKEGGVKHRAGARAPRQPPLRPLRALAQCVRLGLVPGVRVGERALDQSVRARAPFRAARVFARRRRRRRRRRAGRRRRRRRGKGRRRPGRIARAGRLRRGWQLRLRLRRLRARHWRAHQAHSSAGVSCPREEAIGIGCAVNARAAGTAGHAFHALVVVAGHRLARTTAGGGAHWRLGTRTQDAALLRHSNALVAVADPEGWRVGHAGAVRLPGPTAGGGKWRIGHTGDGEVARRTRLVDDARRRVGWRRRRRRRRAHHALAASVVVVVGSIAVRAGAALVDA